MRDDDKFDAYWARKRNREAQRPTGRQLLIGAILFGIAFTILHFFSGDLVNH